MTGTTLQLLVPFYGPAALLELTVASLIAQEDRDWSAIVVDDAAPEGDAARRLVEGRDRRISYVRNPVNLGVTGNFQRCLALADADYVCFPGSDDLLLPAYVGVLHELLAAHPGIDLVQPGVEVIDSVGQPARTAADLVKARLRRRQSVGVPVGGDRLAASLLGGDWLYFPSLCFRRESLQAVGFDLRWRVVEDLAAIIAILLHGGRLVLDDRPVFAYRRHAASVSSVDAADASRFAEERAFLAQTALRCTAAGWPRSAAAARRRWSSRLHAASLVPRVLRANDRPTLRRLVGHAVGR